MVDRDNERHGPPEASLIGPVIAFLIAVAIALAIIFATEAEPAPTQLDDSTSSRFEPRLAQLDREAIDNAYRTKIEQLFTVWLKDPTGQPERAVNGARTARKAYIGAMIEIEKREQLR